MTVRDLYEGLLTEVNNENAPNLILEDFNHYANRAINQYVNKHYTNYDISQQTTDDLRVLKDSVTLTANKSQDYDELSTANMASYYVNLPADYLHLLNCICIYKLQKNYKCYSCGDFWRAPATKLTADAYSQVLDNAWNRPTYKKPYYYIQNIKNSETFIQEETDIQISDIPTKPIQPDYQNAIIPTIEKLQNISFEYETREGRQGWVKLFGEYIGRNNGQYNQYLIYDSSSHSLRWGGNNSTPYSYTAEINDSTEIINIYSLDNTLICSIYKKESDAQSQYMNDLNSYNLNSDSYGNPEKKKKNGQFSSREENGISISNVQRASKVRYGNPSKVRMEIRYGTDNSIFKLEKVKIDYIKTPQFICLTQRELDLTEDTSQVLEFPDYVCQEILKELVCIIMEKNRDQRLQTYPIVSQSIANPTQAQTPETAGQSVQ